MDVVPMAATARRNFAFDAIDDIAKADSVSDVGARFAAAAAKLGFVSIGIAAYPAPKDGCQPTIVTDVRPEGYHDRYIGEGLFQFDHVAAYSRTVAEPFRFSDAPYDAASRRDSERVDQFRHSYGMGKGLMVPVSRFSRDPASAWFAGEDPDLDDEAVRICHLIALFASSRAYALVRRSYDDGPALSARECEVLAWAANGKSAWEIGEILHIAKRTVDEHTQGAMRKLGAANKTQAVAFALVRQLIEI